MDKIGMGVICKNCGKVFGEHFNGDLCPTQFEPATPAPTQPETTPKCIKCGGDRRRIEKSFVRCPECDFPIHPLPKNGELEKSMPTQPEKCPTQEGRLRDGMEKFGAWIKEGWEAEQRRHLSTIMSTEAWMTVSEKFNRFVAIDASPEASQEGGTNE